MCFYSFQEDIYNRFIKIDIRGDVFNILTNIGKQIPFIEALIETKSDETIILDEISPLFFSILIEHLKNQEHHNTFVKKLSNFDPLMIQKWLKYLGMNEMYMMMYGSECKYIDNKLLIKDIRGVQFSTTCAGITIVYVLLNGVSYHVPSHFANPNDILINVSAQKCIGEPKSPYTKYLVFSKVNEQYDTLLKDNYVVENDGSYFITLATAHKFNIISLSERIKNTYKW